MAGVEFSHILPPFWKDEIRKVSMVSDLRTSKLISSDLCIITIHMMLQYLKDDAPTFDIGGFVVGGKLIVETVSMSQKHSFMFYVFLKYRV